MGNILKYTIKIFIRTKHMLYAYLLMIASIIGFLIWCFSSYTSYHDFLFTMQLSMRYSVFGLGLFIYFGYELYIKTKEYNLEECLFINRSSHCKYHIANTIFVFILAMSYFIIFALYDVFLYLSSGIQYGPLLIHLLLCNVLYFMLTPLIGSMAGFAMAQRLKSHRIPVYLITIFLLLMNTTFIEPILQIPYNLFNSASISNAMYNLKDFLTIVPFGLRENYSLDSIYGIPMEPFRWMVSFFWLVSLQILCTFKMYIHNKFKKIKFGCYILLLLVAILLINSNGSILQMDERPNGYVFADQYYYMNHEKFKEAPSEFTIKSCEMDISVSNQLYANVCITLNEQEKAESYDFTLYHGYTVHSIKNEKGEDLPFVRDGDYITINCSSSSFNKIYFDYSGYSPKYYANMQAMALPGYFPYYPFEGRKNIWDYVNWGINTKIPDHTIDFSVNIHTNHYVYSNLPGNGGNFSGTSFSVTLFAGMYEQTNTFLGSPLAQQRIDINDISKVNNMLIDIQNIVGNSYRVPSIDSLKIFQTPENFPLTSNTEDGVILGDHCITSATDEETLRWYVLYGIIPATDENAFFKYLFINYYMDAEGIEGAYITDATSDELYQNLLKFSSFTESEKYQNGSDTIYPILIYLNKQSSIKEQFDEIMFTYFFSHSDESYEDFLKKLLLEEIEHAIN